MEKVIFKIRAELNDVDALARQFRMGTVTEVKDLGGMYNLNLLLATTTGKYVLRVYHPWATQQRLMQLQHLKQRLASAGVPVPLALRGAGDVAVLRHGGRLVEAEPFVEHDGVADSWERYGDAFALLGKMHRVLAAVDIAVEEPEVSNYGTPDVLLGWTQQLVGELRPLAPTPEVRHAREICRRAMQLFGKLQEQWSGVRDALPRQLTHGDYGGGNVLFQCGRVVAVLDFDFLRERERIFELAYALYWWLWTLGNGRLPGMGAWLRVRDLLACYNAEAARPLTQEEVRALPFIMARVPLYWIAEACFLPDPVQKIIGQEEKIGDAAWLLEHRDEIVEMLV